MGVSFYLVNKKGFLSLANLLFGYSKGMATNNPEGMMNWRMLGLHITSLSTSPMIGWGVTIIGSILTVYAVFVISRKPIQSNPIKSAVVLLGIFAATGAVSWHSHFSMFIILIPPMIYLYIQKRLPWKLLLFWAFMPIIIFILVYILVGFRQAKVLPDGIAEMLDLLNGLRGLILNLIFLVWAVIEYTHNDLEKDKFHANLNAS